MARDIININGPEGNAHHLIGVAHYLGRQLEDNGTWERGTAENVIEEMQAGDFTTLVDTFNLWFNDRAKVCAALPMGNH